MVCIICRLPVLNNRLKLKSPILVRFDKRFLGNWIDKWTKGNKNKQAESETCSSLQLHHGRQLEKEREREWWSDRRVEERDERFMGKRREWRTGIRETGGRKGRWGGWRWWCGCEQMSPKMNTREICKLSYSNVEDPHWALSQLAKRPAVTSFCKLTQTPHPDGNSRAKLVVIPTVF